MIRSFNSSLSFPRHSDYACIECFCVFIIVSVVCGYASLASADQHSSLEIGPTSIYNSNGLFGSDPLRGGEQSPSSSDDGSKLVFESDQRGLGPEHENGVFDVFALQVESGVISRVIVVDDQNQGNDPSTAGAICGYGEWMAFSSVAINLVPDDTNGRRDIYVKHIPSGSISRGESDVYNSVWMRRVSLQGSEQY